MTIATLVGMHFKPPAKIVLSVLPAGMPLILRHNPENPYSENAVEVYVSPSAVPESRRDIVNAHLSGFGIDPNDFWAIPAIMLGHVGENKVPEGLATSIEVTAGIKRQGGADLSANLDFDPEGKPLIQVDL